MIEIGSIIEEKSVLSYLQNRNLAKQYKSAKMKLVSGFRGKLDFKERQPKGS